jgi:DnaD/phage-associated family protein
MSYSFDLGVFAVPNSIVDKYIKSATESDLKVLLYCFRHSGQVLTEGEISRATGVAPAQVTVSLELCKKIMNDNPTQSENRSLSKESKAKAKVMLERDHEFTPKEISDTIKSSKDVENLFKCCEGMYGRPLKHTEQKALAIIIEEVGMKPEVALMLMGYCFSVEKTSSGYIKAVAKNWLEQGVNTISLAELHIKQLNENAGSKSNQENNEAAMSSFDLDELDRQIMEEYNSST